MNAHKFEADTVRRLSAGDVAAQREFVTHFQPLLRFKVRMRSGSAEGKSISATTVSIVIWRVRDVIKQP